jgi:hypothetical protein
MKGEQSPGLRYLHEGVSSCNLALALIALFLLSTNRLTSAVFAMDRELETAISFHLGQLPAELKGKYTKDFTEGYFALALPSVVLASALWLALRLSAQSKLTREYLRSVAGILSLAASPIWWLCARYLSEGKDGWSPFNTAQLYEIAVVAASAMVCLWKGWDITSRTSIVIILMHFGFWLWQFGPSVYLFGYGGPIAPTVGLFASLAWVAYMKHNEATPPPARRLKKS